MNSAERVRYRKSPLIEVIFQLRFPTILKINASQPVEFQEQIRKEYPIFGEQTESQGDIQINSQQQSAQLRKLGENKNYSFVSADYLHKVNLTPSFISFSTKSYTRWEEFRERIEFLIPIFERFYEPSFYIRSGLRYVNLIDRSKLGLQTHQWSKLVRPHLLGMISGNYEHGIKSYLSDTEYETSVMGVFSKAHLELVQVNNEPDLSLLLDCDYYYLDKTELQVRSEIAESLHAASTDFIQHAFTDRLSQAMEPEVLKP